MSQLNLSEEDLTILSDCFTKYIPGYRVLAYGSRVKGIAHSASDLDLVIQNTQNESKPAEHLYELKEALSDSDLPILVDILDWARLPDSFKAEINANHVQIWP